MRVRFLVFTLIFSLWIPQVAAAQAAVVSPSELQQAITTAAKNRQKNHDDVQAFFSSEPDPARKREIVLSSLRALAPQRGVSL